MHYQQITQINHQLRDDLLVWVDLEMTGLNLEQDKIIEIAAIITDQNLSIIAQSPSIAVKTSKRYLDQMSPFVQQMHNTNGLIERVKKSTISITQAEQIICEMIAKYCQPQTSPLCGNSIYNDRMFIRRYMPKLDQLLHYRLLDVSSIKIFAQTWRPELAPYHKQSTHLALNDIEQSIKELQYYRERL